MKGIDGYKVHHHCRIWHVRVRQRRGQQQLASLPRRNLPVSVHLLPRHFCALQMAKSSSADQGSRFIDGSNWFLKRSRHCLPVRPGSCPAMTAHFRRPWTVTSCLISSSSCQIERGTEKLIPAANLICHYTVRPPQCAAPGARSGGARAELSGPHHLLRPGLATQIKAVVVSLIIVFRARDGRVQHVLFGHLQAAGLGMFAFRGLEHRHLLPARKMASERDEARRIAFRHGRGDKGKEDTRGDTLPPRRRSFCLSPTDRPLAHGMQE